MVLPTLRRYAPGFWKKTMEEFGRGAQTALKLEALSIPTTPRPLLNFNDPETLSWMKIMSDRSVGGSSTADLTQIPASSPSTEPGSSSEETPTHALFHGHISTALPPSRPDIQRTGYAAFRNQDRGHTAFGRLFWDIDPYRYLALRVKSDGRRYFVNIQTDSIVETDIHQHRLYTRHHKGAASADAPAQWETVLIKFNEFVRTNHGTVTEPQSEMLRQKIKSFGIGLTDRQEGPFELAIGAMWATNLNERGLLDGKLGGGGDEEVEGGDLGSARLAEVTEEKLRERREERERLPEEKRGWGLKERLPEHFGKVGTRRRRGDE